VENLNERSADQHRRGVWGKELVKTVCMISREGRKGSMRTSSPSTNFPMEEAAADVEEKRLEFVLGEKLCGLRNVQNCLKWAQ